MKEYTNNHVAEGNYESFLNSLYSSPETKLCDFCNKEVEIEHIHTFNGNERICSDCAKEITLKDIAVYSNDEPEIAVFFVNEIVKIQNKITFK